MTSACRDAPAQTNRKPYIKPAGPPFCSPFNKVLYGARYQLVDCRAAVEEGATDAVMASQVIIRVLVRPIAEMRPNPLCNGQSVEISDEGDFKGAPTRNCCRLPKRAMTVSSLTELCRLKKPGFLSLSGGKSLSKKVGPLSLRGGGWLSPSSISIL